MVVVVFLRVERHGRYEEVLYRCRTQFSTGQITSHAPRPYLVQYLAPREGAELGQGLQPIGALLVALHFQPTNQSPSGSSTIFLRFFHIPLHS